MASNKPSPEDYRVLIHAEWADLHHSRIQEWTALGVVTAAHVGLLQLVNVLREANTLSLSTLAILGSMVAAIFAAFGALMTLRHRHLMRIKLRWIYEAEEHLGLVKTAENPEGVVPENAKVKTEYEWRRLAIPRPLSTSWLILCFFVLLFIMDLFALVMFGL